MISDVEARLRALEGRQSLVAKSVNAQRQVLGQMVQDAILLTAAGLALQQDDCTGTAKVTVLDDTGAVYTTATVRYKHNGTQVALGDTAAGYSQETLPAGSYFITVTAEGFQDANVGLNVLCDQLSQVTVHLKKSLIFCATAGVSLPQTLFLSDPVYGDQTLTWVGSPVFAWRGDKIITIDAVDSGLGLCNPGHGTALLRWEVSCSSSPIALDFRYEFSCNASIGNLPKPRSSGAPADGAMFSMQKFQHSTGTLSPTINESMHYDSSSDGALTDTFHNVFYPGVDPALVNWIITG